MSAFPVLSLLQDRDGNYSLDQEGGLTKRELFAAMAMQGMMSTEMALKSTRTPRDLMRGCAEVADALIAELAKAQP
jgi:hypothetical protein